MQLVLISKVFYGGLNQKCPRGGITKRAEAGQTSRDFQKWSVEDTRKDQWFKDLPVFCDSAVRDYLKPAARVGFYYQC